MSTGESVSLRAFYDEMDKAETERAKRRYRGHKLAMRQIDIQAERAKPSQDVAQILLYRRNTWWIAKAGNILVEDGNPEFALNRLLARLHFSADDKERRKRLYRSVVAPSCDVRDFNAKPDLDGNCHYVVDFTTNVRLCRGDIEGLFCAMMRGASQSGALGMEAQYETKEEATAEA